MKNSKRSLIVAIAVLCVCALALSTATFAWFTAAKTANVENITLKVRAQSDIKIAADKAALDSSASDLWKTTLTQDMFTGDNKIEEYISDVTPATAGTCNGNFNVPEIRDNVDVATGAYSGNLVPAGEGWAEFKVYVRTTEKKDVVFTFSDFTYVANGGGAANASEALRLGVMNNGKIYETNATEVVLTAAEQAAFSDGDGFCGTVSFYVWVEGTDEACINANALSLKNYSFNMSFAYAA